jgi:hypothetical protein
MVGKAIPVDRGESLGSIVHGYLWLLCDASFPFLLGVWQANEETYDYPGVIPHLSPISAYYREFSDELNVAWFSSAKGRKAHDLKSQHQN